MSVVSRESGDFAEPVVGGLFVPNSSQNVHRSMVSGGLHETVFF